MKDLGYGVVPDMLDGTADIATNDRVEKGIEVVAEVALGNIENSEQIKITFSPDVATLLPQAEMLFRRVHARARAMMFQKLTDRYNDISYADTCQKCKAETIRVYADISMPGGIIASLSSAEIEFAPKDIGETCVFEHEAMEKAKETLLMQLLAGFAELGGH